MRKVTIEQIIAADVLMYLMKAGLVTFNTVSQQVSVETQLVGVVCKSLENYAPSRLEAKPY